MRYDLSLSDAMWGWVVGYTVTAMSLQVVGGFLFHLYLGRSRIGSFDEASALGVLVLIEAIILAALFMALNPAFSRGIAVGLPILALVFMAAGRFVFRNIFRTHRRRQSAEVTPAVIYGAGDAGHQVARLLETSDDSPYQVVGFIDDDPYKRFLRVRGSRVLGTGRELVELARRQGADAVILAITHASPRMLQDLQVRCAAAGLKLLVVPPVRELIGGQVSLGQLREFDVVDLLGRREINTDLSGISGVLTGKTVLVTGAGGSIGSELARQVSKLGPAKLILLDRDESALHAVQLSLYGNGMLDTDDMVLCDIRDREALGQVFARHKPEVVFHAAALKHLPMLEQYPDEGWKTNVLGTLNVLQCAHASGAQRVVNISTDKAADATSVLGQTKRLAERLTAWFAREHDVSWVSVRFGNVLGSRGSVLYTFKAQIDRGGPVTITHPEITRYFMTIPEACELVLQAAAIGKPGDVLVLDMGHPVKILDVARRLIDQAGVNIPIKYTGLRVGEKLHEVLLSETEVASPSAHPLITQVEVPLLSPNDVMFSDPDEAASRDQISAPRRVMPSTPEPSPPTAKSTSTSDSASAKAGA